ncbi:protein src2, partial [Quercus suber]
MSYRPLELVIQSAQGLKYVNHVKKMKPYAVVFIRDHNNVLHSSERKTSVDSEGGSKPTWNFNVKFTISLAIAQKNHLDLVIKLKSRRKSHGIRDKDIGEVRVLISELLKCFGDDAAEDEKHMSKSIVTSDGEAQGALAFSYKFGRTVDHPPTDPNVKQRPKRGANGFAAYCAQDADISPQVAIRKSCHKNETLRSGLPLGYQKEPSFPKGVIINIRRSVDGSNPTWSFKVIRFHIDITKAQENHYALVVKLKSCRKTHCFPDKYIGEVRVPRTLQAELAFSYNFGSPIADHLTLVNIRKKKILTKVVGKL